MIFFGIIISIHQKIKCNYVPKKILPVLTFHSMSRKMYTYLIRIWIDTSALGSELGIFNIEKLNDFFLKVPRKMLMMQVVGSFEKKLQYICITIGNSHPLYLQLLQVYTLVQAIQSANWNLLCVVVGHLI